MKLMRMRDSKSGNHIYTRVSSFQKKDVYNTQASPAFTARSGCLSPQRWTDESSNDAGLIEAAMHGQVDRLSHLLQQADKNVVLYLDTCEKGALHSAGESGRVEVTRMLIR